MESLDLLVDCCLIRAVSAASVKSATMQFNPDRLSLRTLRPPSLCVSC